METSTYQSLSCPLHALLCKVVEFLPSEVVAVGQARMAQEIRTTKRFKSLSAREE